MDLEHLISAGSVSVSNSDPEVQGKSFTKSDLLGLVNACEERVDDPGLWLSLSYPLSQPLECDSPANNKAHVHTRTC